MMTVGSLIRWAAWEEAVCLVVREERALGGGQVALGSHHVTCHHNTETRNTIDHRFVNPLNCKSRSTPSSSLTALGYGYSDPQSAIHVITSSSLPTNFISQHLQMKSKRS